MKTRLDIFPEVLEAALRGDQPQTQACCSTMVRQSTPARRHTFCFEREILLARSCLQKAGMSKMRDTAIAFHTPRSR